MRNEGDGLAEPIGGEGFIIDPGAVQLKRRSVKDKHGIVAIVKAGWQNLIRVHALPSIEREQIWHASVEKDCISRSYALLHPQLHVSDAECPIPGQSSVGTSLCSRQRLVSCRKTLAAAEAGPVPDHPLCP